MVHSLPLAALTAALVLLSPALAESLYPKNSAVLQVSGSTYDSLIAKSNYTSILEFYAPWCGHCKNLQPAYEKAAKSLSGLAKVAAINCDEESNKPFCGSMGVQGFPTLKIIKPGKKPGKPIVNDYEGARTAKGIVDAVLDKIPNHVKRLKDDDYEAWLEDGDGAKAILFSEKGSTSALLKSIAIDFLGAIGVAQARSTETEAVGVFQVEKFPTLVLLPGAGKDPVTYDGEMKKEKMVEFLKQAAEPNPDPAPKKGKAKKTDEKKASKDSSTFAEASKSHESAESAATPAAETPEPAPPIDSLTSLDALNQKCLNTKSSTCVLAFLSTSDSSPDSTRALTTLAELHHKHVSAKRPLFPFYALPASNPANADLRTQLGLSTSADAVELVAVNGKRAWFRKYPSASGFGGVEIADWVDAIRMGDGAKEKLPEGIIVDVSNLPVEPTAEKKAAKEAPVQEEKNDEETGKKDKGGTLDNLREMLKASVPEGVKFAFDDDDEDGEGFRDAKITFGKKKGEGMVVGKGKGGEEVEEEHDEL